MRSALLLLFVLHLFARSASADTALITLDDGLTWKAMFDAGFRPSYIGEGIYECRQMNVRVQIRKNEGGDILDLGVGDVEFSLREGHLLDLVSFYGRKYRAVGEVEEKSDVFSRMFRTAVTQKAQFGWFADKYAEGYSGERIDPPEITRQVDDRRAVNAAKIEDLAIVYSFRSVNKREKPMVERFSISLGSGDALRAGRLKTRIEPPNGYEHVSLEQRLAGSVNRRGEPAPATKSPIPAAPLRVASPPEVVARNADYEIERPSTFWPWLLGVFAVTVLVFMAWKRHA